MKKPTEAGKRAAMRKFLSKYLSDADISAAFRNIDVAEMELRMAAKYGDAWRGMQEMQGNIIEGECHRVEEEKKAPRRPARKRA